MNVFKQGYSVILYPEGTRSRDGKLLKPNLAIIRLCYKSGIPVVSCAIEGTRDILPRNRIYFKIFKKIVLKFNKPLYPKDFKSEEEFTKECWGRVKSTRDEIIKEHFPKKIMSN
jgi:1-acyl-sn-glycerol-3-phosphate acyltransferase